MKKEQSIFKYTGIKNVCHYNVHNKKIRQQRKIIVKF